MLLEKDQLGFAHSFLFLLRYIIKIWLGILAGQEWMHNLSRIGVIGTSVVGGTYRGAVKLAYNLLDWAAIRVYYSFLFFF